MKEVDDFIEIAQNIVGTELDVIEIAHTLHEVYLKGYDDGDETGWAQSWEDANFTDLGGYFDEEDDKEKED